MIKIVTLKGADIIPYISDLATLRIEIFRSYPYLYEGNFEYEKKYLQTYVKCPESIVVLVFDDKKIVGASTAIPLEFETDEVQKPFLENNIPIKDVFYFGESVLKPEYRGQKIYRKFFKEREAAARMYHSRIAAFAAVERAIDDPRKPQNYTPLDEVWSHFGYLKHPELCAYFEWKEIGENEQTAKPLIFWLKNL
jgi:hypothetical protein